MIQVGGQGEDTACWEEHWRRSQNGQTMASSLPLTAVWPAESCGPLWACVLH